MYTSISGRGRHSGFTIVELLMVIVVIAILAAITIVAYNGLQTRAITSQVKAGLTQSQKTIELAKVTGGELYPGSLTFPSSGIVQNYYQRDTGTGYCTDAYSSKDQKVQYHVTNAVGVTEGLCTENPYEPAVPEIPTQVAADSCFEIDNYNGWVRKYYNNENNDSSQPACPKNVTVPSTISGKVATQISLDAFKNMQITAVNLPSGITEIQQGAFEGNLLTRVVVPDTVTSIGSSAFENNKLTSVVLSSSLVEIQQYAFMDNQLTTVNLPDSLTTLGKSAFYNNKLTSVRLSNGLGAIGERTFYKNQLTKVAVPSSVNSIGSEAFRDNQIATLTLQPGLIQIGGMAFFNNKITSLDVPATVTEIKYNAFEDNMIASLNIPDRATLTLGDKSFFNNQFDLVSIPHDTALAPTVFDYRVTINRR